MYFLKLNFKPILLYFLYYIIKSAFFYLDNKSNIFQIKILNKFLKKNKKYTKKIQENNLKISKIKNEGIKPIFHYNIP